MKRNDGLSIPPLRAPFTNDNYVIKNKVDQFRIYDDMIVKWLGDIEYPVIDRIGVEFYPSVPVVLAPPERAFASVSQVLNTGTTNSQSKQRQVPYPFISVFRLDEVYDMERYTFSRRRNLINNKQLPHPLPYIFPYQIEVWAKGLTTLNYLTQWILLQFEATRLHLPVDFSIIDDDIFSSQKPVHIPVLYKSSGNTSDTEPGEKERTLRKTIDIEVNGWLFRPSKQVKPVHTIKTNVYDCDTNIILDTREDQ